MKVVRAVSGVPIRLTRERWLHIAARHPEMKRETDRVETIASPDYVQAGDRGTLIAVKHYPRTPLTEKHLVVVYREIGRNDGFVVTAYLTSLPAAWRRIVWKL